LNFPTLEQSPLIVSTDLPIKEYLYHNPPIFLQTIASISWSGLTKDNLASNITAAADTGTTNADAAIVDVFVEKDPERGQKRKTAVIEGRSLEQNAERDRSNAEQDHNYIRQKISKLEDEIADLRETRKLDDGFFMSYFRQQQVLLEWETATQMLRALNDKMLDKLCASRPNFEFPPRFNNIEKLLVCASGDLQESYDKKQYKAAVENLAMTPPVPGTRPFGRLTDAVEIKKADAKNPKLYAQKVFSSGSPFQLFSILHKTGIRESGNNIAHIRPSIMHATRCVILFSTQSEVFEKESAMTIVNENQPLLDKKTPFTEVEADEGMQHTLAERAEEGKLKRARNE
ncbi:hypothetical protein BT96DRAFT_927993, partial [Gymnopus androsaceus JB14]